jgi:hypothetical protein
MIEIWAVMQASRRVETRPDRDPSAGRRGLKKYGASRINDAEVYDYGASRVKKGGTE